MQQLRKDERPIELRPRAVLAVGVTGHRNIGTDADRRALRVALDSVFTGLSDGLKSVAERERAFFSKAEPRLRTICMAAEGADLLGAQAARAAGSEIACVLPFVFEEYRHDFSAPDAARAAQSAVEEAEARFELPGSRDEGPRSYERANEIILAKSDLLVAVWNGKRAAGRAGTGDVVQAAMSRRIPVIVIAPEAPTLPTLLRAPVEEDLAPPTATDLARTPLGGDMAELVSQILSPPSGNGAEQGLVDLLAEQPGYRSARFEYPLLLKLFGITGKNKRPADSPHRPVPDAARGPDETLASTSELAPVVDRIDSLANHYARLYRSSAVSEILLAIVAAFIAVLTFIFFPVIAGVSLLVPIAVNGLIIADVTIRTKRRWHERWLDYRVIAERLRCLRFLHPLGLGLKQDANPFHENEVSWVAWYVRRHERSLDPPHGLVEAAEIARRAQRLADMEIADQLDYHRKAFRQLGLFDRRLSIAATFALGAATAAAVLFGISAYFAGSTERVSWRPLAVIVLSVLPAIAAAFTGIRSGADLVRLVERSETTAAGLTNLQNIIRSASMTYDRLAVAAARAAEIMTDELSEWRFVLESKRFRGRRGRSTRST